MDPRNREAFRDAVHAELDGRHRFDIEREARVAGTRRRPVRAGSTGWHETAKAQAVALGFVLIYMRRTRASIYSAGDHAMRVRSAERVDPFLAAGVRAGGHLIGSRVAVVGEDLTGVIVQVSVTREYDGEYARWYVVDLAEPELYRAYGCDELETVLDQPQGPVLSPVPSPVPHP